MVTALRADLSRREVVSLDSIPWVPSPAKGVDRRMLDRRALEGTGGEVARATTVVRYAPASSFDTHVHALGEEFYVLDGIFSDEHGDYPAGTYVRNPPGSSHAPYTKDGCTIFVKLRQFEPDDSERVVIDTRSAAFLPGQVPGLTVLPLHQFRGENVALVRWAPGTQFLPHTHFGGEEILVLEGVFSDEHADYPAGTWLRSPHLSKHTPHSGPGCLLYVKVGHLAPD